VCVLCCVCVCVCVCLCVCVYKSANAHLPVSVLVTVPLWAPELLCLGVPRLRQLRVPFDKTLSCAMATESGGGAHCSAARCR